ncbi:MAG: FG-GAP-like repeat-containing protein [Candidatus Cloacimonetes bacterium]|nr:FG-GAP-like repeat-containing protein [Candidatus Cloacimonadota bacterium]
MKKEVILFILLIISVISQLSGQDELEAISTWENQWGLSFRCQNYNRGGSDLNNDGYDDYIHWNPEATYSFQFFMGAADLNTTSNFTIEVPFGSGGITWGGDLNGDGYMDMVFTIINDWNDPGEIHICLGGDIIDLEPEFILEGEDYGFGAQGYNGGYDFNGDGYDDLLIWTIGSTPFGNGRIQIISGGEEFDTEPDFQLTGNYGDELGKYRAVCDLNGDGYDDLIVSRYESIEGPVRYELYLGGSEMDTVCDHILIEECLAGEFCIMAGDHNGDNIEEVIIGIGANGLLGSYYIDQEGELICEQNNLEDPSHIMSVDVNGDQFTDILSWNPYQDTIKVYYGGPGSDYESDILLPYPEGLVHLFMCNTGDVNGDGQNEILINNASNNILGNTATIYGLPGSNARRECVIENGKWKIENYPNPFNPSTVIEYAIVEAGDVELSIYNIRGQLVKCLVNEQREPGIYHVSWDGNDKANKPVSSGIYFSVMKAGNEFIRDRMILLK